MFYSNHGRNIRFSSQKIEFNIFVQIMEEISRPVFWDQGKYNKHIFQHGCLYLRGMDTFSEEITDPKLFCFPLEKGSRFFTFRAYPFSEGDWCDWTHTGSHKSCLLCKNESPL